MYDFIICVLLAFMIFPITNVNGIEVELVLELNKEIDKVNNLIGKIQRDCHDERDLYELPLNLLPRIMERAERVLNRVLLVLEDLYHDCRKIDTRSEEKEERSIVKNTRRSEKPNIENEFYVALAKILKNKLQNESLIKDKDINEIIEQYIKT